ncbi:hypothetical protein [Methylocapsa aurea]|uniref:hypothetical protein n=1 Tax=Methylocapsa aurea TaxID=663610 RepID=UPI0012EB7FEA|nr:hypothetical protein [Methylocapsa aurea]
MPKDYADRIAKLKEKKEKLGERLGALEQKAKAETRKRDTRRKIIVGGAVLAQMGKDSVLASMVRKLLAASVGRPMDREAIADLLPPPMAHPANQQTAPVPPPRPALSQVEEETARMLGRLAASSAPIQQAAAPSPAPLEKSALSATFGYKPK